MTAECIRLSGLKRARKKLSDRIEGGVGYSPKGIRDGTPQSSVPQWDPPVGDVGAETVCRHFVTECDCRNEQKLKISHKFRMLLISDQYVSR